MARLAWFSPWPPQPSGIAGRSAELVPLLAARGHAIDVFVDASNITTVPASSDAPVSGGVRVVSAHDFLWRHARGHYDLPVYQIGNSHLHRFIWPYLFRYPGLAVMHEGRVHHARAEALLSRGRYRDYRAEFAWNHPDVPVAAADLAVLRLEGAFYYQWPMVRTVVETARLAASHSAGVAAQLAREYPHRPIIHIALGEGPRAFDVDAARRRFRAQHAIAEDAIVFGVHGGITAEKRIHEILNAFAVTQSWIPRARLLLVGADDPLVRLRARLDALQLGSTVIHVPSADNDEFDRSIAASDVTINLRWPSALETSGPWVRSLAMGRPSITIDSAHQSHVPSLDPFSWQRIQPADDLDPGAVDRGVTVALDVLNLSSGLRAAMRRLGTDTDLRAALGRQARLWWEREHTVERMVSDYERAFTQTLDTPLPGGDLPAHFRPDANASSRQLLSSTAWHDPDVFARLPGQGS